jgi:hypothetical protein
MSENKYLKKYIKYKNKYLNLKSKNQLAGSPNAKFEYSINNPNTISEFYSGKMFDKIEEFETQTKSPYINSLIRKVNEIDMNQNTFIIDFFRKNSKNRKLLTTEINEYLMKDNWYEYFLYITRFYNSTITYDESTINNGTIVKQKKLTSVFKDEYITTPEYQSHIDEEDNYIGTRGKGFGNDNLLCTLKEISKVKPELKVLYLHANGDENLVNYYRNIGFNVLVENLVPHYNSAGKPIAIYEYIMFGMYDEIIKKLEGKTQSNCDNLVK